MISQQAIDLIVYYEVTDEKTYTNRYQRPTWPEGASGVTVGIGYDLGYASRDKIENDWKGKVSALMLDNMILCSGAHGKTAQQLRRVVRPKILVPWKTAMEVFLEGDVPEWTTTVVKKIPKAANLHPHCLGAIVSLAYNRGPSFDNSGGRYKEMRMIKFWITTNQLSKVSAEIRAMKRLWPNVKGLRVRRDAEAKLFELGLQASTAT